MRKRPYPKTQFDLTNLLYYDLEPARHKMSATDFSVLLAIAFHTNPEDGWLSRPTQNFIATRLNISDRSVRNSITKLKELGVFGENGYSAGSKNCATHYKLDVDKIYRLCYPDAEHKQTSKIVYDEDDPDWIPF